MPVRTRPSVSRRLLPLAGLVLALVLPGTAALAQATMEEIARGQRPAASPAAPAAAPAPVPPGGSSFALDRLPTLGDIASGNTAPRPPAQQQPVGCPLPPGPGKLPDGKTATDAEMRAAHERIKAFVTGGEAFLACLAGVYQQHGMRLSVADYLAMVRGHDRMVNTMEVVAAQFNEQLRVYRAR